MNTDMKIKKGIEKHNTNIVRAKKYKHIAHDDKKYS